ncbi:MAG: hypothetical protein J5876_03280 [Lachnospiraceae bacterium]|nr:hypothetical protein [Lachnospiraceae bacterium]
MKIRKLVCIFLIITLLLSGCGKANTSSTDSSTSKATDSQDITSDDSDESSDNSDESESEPEAKSYTFEPHLHTAFLSEFIGDDRLQSMYNLIDAIREGKDTFECLDEETYKICTSEVVLSDFYPPACVYVTGESNDGTTPYENGIGRIYYTIPKEEFMEKCAAFENEVNRILSETVKVNYTDFEKCLALYEFVTVNFEYNYGEWPGYEPQGATFHCTLYKTGICCEIASVYTYLLQTCGVDAIDISGSDHEWTYVRIDNEGYHIDPTWGLHYEDMDLSLMYFMETDEKRYEDGLDTSNLRFGSVYYYTGGTYADMNKYTATSKKYSTLWNYCYVDINRNKKILYYKDFFDDKIMEFEY